MSGGNVGIIIFDIVSRFFRMANAQNNVTPDSVIGRIFVE